MNYKFCDIVDISIIQDLMQSQWEVSGIMLTLLDPDENILAHAGLQTICTKFHRAHPETLRLCQQSDSVVKKYLHKFHKHKGHLEYTCENGLMNIALPIFIDQHHMATLFTGQFLYEEPDLQFFRQQAQKYHFDEETYIAALKEVPILSPDKLKTTLGFLSKFVSLLTRMGMEKVQRLEVQERLLCSERKFRSLFENSSDAVYIVHKEGRLLAVNREACEQFGYTESELLTKSIVDLLSPDRAPYFESRTREILQKGHLIFETVHVRKNGTLFPAEVSVRPFEYQGQETFLASFRNISARKRAENALHYRQELESLIASISSDFLAQPPEKLDPSIDAALCRLGEFAHVDRCYIFCITKQRFASCTHEWCAKGVSPQKAQNQKIDIDTLPWAKESILKRQIIHVPQVTTLPAEAHAEKKAWRDRDIFSLLVVPYLTAGEVTGFVGFDSIKSGKIWEKKNFTLLQTAAEIIGSAIERQLAAQRLQQSEKRLSLALQVSNEGVWDWQVDTSEAYFSPRYFTMLGYADSELPHAQETWIQLLHPDDREAAIAKTSEVLETGKNFAMEFRMRTKNGDYIDILSRGQAVEFTPEGKPVRLVGTHMDITERKKTESALQAAHRNLKDIIEFIPDATLVIDRNKKLVAWNRAIEEMTGVSKKEILGKGDYAYSIPFYGARRPIMIDLVGTPDEILELEYDFVQRQGDRLVAEGFVPSLYGGNGGYIWGIAAPLYDQNGEVVGTIESIRDITDRKNNEKALNRALQESEEARDKIDAILKSVGDGVIVADLSHRVTLMNRAAERMLDNSLAETLFQPVEQLLTEQAYSAQVKALISGDKKEAQVEWSTPAEKGRTPRTIQARISVVLNSEEQKSGTITLLRDVTRERELDQMKSEFISTAAHELRTPLTSVMGFTEVLMNQDGYGITEEEERHELLKAIYEKSKRLEAIISDLLSLARIQSGQLISLEMTHCDICQTLSQMISEYQLAIPERIFKLDIPPSPLELVADRSKVDQVLENLLSNAVKFSRRQTTIRIKGETIGAYFRISIKDEGIGMTEEQVERIFDKFYRVDATNTGVQGLGLGMPIVKSIIEAHGGSIWIESEMGKGTKVSFTLPLAPVCTLPE